MSGKLHKPLHNFLVNRKQRVVLNGQVSSWANVFLKVQFWAHCSFLSILMTFNPDPNKQDQEAFFSRKTKKINPPLLTFSKSTVSQTASTSQKYFGVILDSRSFHEHLIRVQSKTN